MPTIPAWIMVALQAIPVLGGLFKGLFGGGDDGAMTQQQTTYEQPRGYQDPFMGLLSMMGSGMFANGIKDYKGWGGGPSTGLGGGFPEQLLSLIGGSEGGFSELLKKYKDKSAGTKYDPVTGRPIPGLPPYLG